MKHCVSVCVLALFATISFACDDGWQSYNGHCYKLFPAATQSAGVRGCEDEGAFLACVMDNDENAFISSRVANNARAFLGHTDEGNEGVWRCTEGTIERVWWRGEPNNCCGGENCAEINFGGRGMWNDVGCGARFRYVCEKEGPCVGDWVHFDGHCYLNVVSPVNFDEAERNCVIHDAHLVCIDTSEENDFVANMAEGIRAWTGHTDRGSEGVWMCTGENSSPSNWGGVEPNNWGAGENCAETNFGSAAAWNDVACGTSLPYVCEKQDIEENTDCAEGWTQRDGRCYKLFQEAQPYTNAKTTCRESHAELVCIADRRENEFISEMANRQRTYIGHVDVGAEGIWHCDSGNGLGDVWWSGEPNNCCGGEDCAEINFGSTRRWNDNNCAARLASVCEKNEPCRNGWSGYENHCYKYQPITMNWRDAQSSCQTLDATLVCIGNDGENDHVAQLTGGQRAWVGSTDADHEGAWMCTGEDGTVSSWWNGEPNNWGGREDCAEINFGSTGRWNDVGCLASFPFICEKPATNLDPCEFVTNFFNHCTTDSRDECAVLVTAIANLENGCVSNCAFLAGMTGMCVIADGTAQ